MVGIEFNILPQPADRRRDPVVVVVSIMPPLERLDCQIAAGKYLVRMIDEEGQQEITVAAQEHALAVDPDLARGAVNTNTPGRGGRRITAGAALVEPGAEHGDG